jgi:putative Mg2+ transporter-C (MgtC) family protein
VNSGELLESVFWTQLGMAVLCGAVLGLERQLRGKPAGMRTSILICLGTVMFMRLGDQLAAHTGDPARAATVVLVGVQRLEHTFRSLRRGVHADAGDDLP